MAKKNATLPKNNQRNWAMEKTENALLFAGTDSAREEEIKHAPFKVREL
jgi:hypothetical protein